jgi:hypothetical protein
MIWRRRLQDKCNSIRISPVRTVRSLLAVRAEDLLSWLRNDEFTCLVAGLRSRCQLSDLADGLSGVLSAPPNIRMFYFYVPPNIGIERCPAHGVRR